MKTILDSDSSAANTGTVVPHPNNEYPRKNDFNPQAMSSPGVINEVKQENLDKRGLTFFQDFKILLFQDTVCG